jgi:hypothetical protein
MNPPDPKENGHFEQQNIDLFYEKIDRIGVILHHPIKTDDDYTFLSELVNDESED